MRRWPTSARPQAVHPAWITAVPVVRLGDVIERLARAAGGSSSGSLVSLVARRESRPPQREMANAVQQAANVRGAFTIIAAPPPGTGVLLDDRRHSGWTLAMVGGQLRSAGAERVVPLVLGTLN